MTSVHQVCCLVSKPGGGASKDKFCTFDSHAKIREGMSEIFKFIFRLMIYAADACCSVWKPECFKTEHVSGA